MFLLALDRHEGLAATLEKLARIDVGHASIRRFSNGEAEIETPVIGRRCVVLGSIAPPDEDLLATLLLCHTLRKESARRITALLPYLGYARQDKDEPGKSLGTAWADSLLGAAAVNDVVTVDVQSEHAHGFLPMPVYSLSPAPLIAKAIQRLGWRDTTIVAPDEGALLRCEQARRGAGIARPVAWFVKKRTPGGVIHSAMEGGAGSRVVLVDDILDTAGTLVSACEALVQKGVDEIAVMATHGLFTGAAWRRLWSVGVSQIHCTDTSPLPPSVARDRITVIPVAPLLAEWIATQHVETNGDDR